MDPIAQGSGATSVLPSTDATPTEAITTEAGSADTGAGNSEAVQQDSKPTIDWDSPDNPYRERFNGTQGALKQHQERVRQMEAQLETYRIQAEQLQRQQEEQARRQQEAQLDEMLSTRDPSEVVETLRQRREAEKQRQAWEKQYQPQVMSQAQKAVQAQYEQGMFTVAKELGMSDDEVRSVASQTGQFSDFVRGLITKAVDKQQSNIDQKLETLLAEKTKALEEQIRALSRGAERTPNSDTGSVPSGGLKNADEANVAFYEGRLTADAWLKEMQRFGKA